MMRLILSLPLILAACLPALAADDETYKIKLLHFPAEGKSVKSSETSKITQAVKATDQDGKVVRDDKTVTNIKTAYTEKTIKGGEKKQKQFSRTYTQAEETTGGKTKKEGFAGKTILFELEDGKYKAKAEGKEELDKKDAEALEQDVNKDVDGSLKEALLPKKAVKVGDTWKIEPKAVATFLKFLKADPEKSKGEGKLAKAYKKDGKQFGVMEFTFESTTKDESPGKANVTLSVDVPIDGSSATGKVTSKLKFTQNSTVEMDGVKYKVEAKVDVEGTSERQDVAEKK